MTQTKPYKYPKAMIEALKKVRELYPDKKAFITVLKTAEQSINEKKLHKIEKKK